MSARLLSAAGVLRGPPRNGPHNTRPTAKGGGGMTVWVDAPGSAGPVACEVPATATARELKAAFCKAAGWRPAQTRLRLGGTVLRDDALLADEGVAAEARVEAARMARFAGATVDTADALRRGFTSTEGYAASVAAGQYPGPRPARGGLTAPSGPVLLLSNEVAGHGEQQEAMRWTVRVSANSIFAVGAVPAHGLSAGEVASLDTGAFADGFVYCNYGPRARYVPMYNRDVIVGIDGGSGHVSVRVPEAGEAGTRDIMVPFRGPARLAVCVHVGALVKCTPAPASS